ncbi:hypothetical protein [Staphylococcus delphini]|uniref:hypothetical protein n=1 Tax=Staphylococcus delphini TaxID=53344 RepID=UPI0012D2D701|nr:hypothetical protein [Staphylococcus delphini]MTV23570.1 hypothetical protein [Staphylococcus delphini]
MYLLELQQYDTRQFVGLFKTEEEVKSWLETVDGMKLHKEIVEDIQFETYYMTYADLPDYQEVHWHNSHFILSRYTFAPDEGDIVAVYSPVPVLADTTGLVPGQTKVGSYSIPNEEAHDYITAFNEMKSFLRNHFKQAHQDVAILGQGSEDGEYLMVDDRFICHVEGALVDQWLEKSSPEAFLKANPFLSL